MIKYLKSDRTINCSASIKKCIFVNEIYKNKYLLIHVDLITTGEIYWMYNYNFIIKTVSVNLTKINSCITTDQTVTFLVPTLIYISHLKL